MMWPTVREYNAEAARLVVAALELQAQASGGAASRADGSAGATGANRRGGGDGGDQGADGMPARTAGKNTTTIAIDLVDWVFTDTQSAIPFVRRPVFVLRCLVSEESAIAWFKAQRTLYRGLEYNGKADLADELFWRSLLGACEPQESRELGAPSRAGGGGGSGHASPQLFETVYLNPDRVFPKVATRHKLGPFDTKPGAHLVALSTLFASSEMGGIQLLNVAKGENVFQLKKPQHQIGEGGTMKPAGARAPSSGGWSVIRGKGSITISYSWS